VGRDKAALPAAFGRSLQAECRSVDGKMHRSKGFDFPEAIVLENQTTER
jgi:hypothetical protein